MKPRPNFLLGGRFCAGATSSLGKTSNSSASNGGGVRCGREALAGVPRGFKHVVGQL